MVVPLVAEPLASSPPSNAPPPSPSTLGAPVPPPPLASTEADVVALSP
jgi:hypothetical protein